jgi:predicted oxidoreductase
MRISKVDKKEAARFVSTALDLGATFFDHADKYSNGACEEIFADVIGMNPSVRDKVTLQSKCGIRNGTFDFSKAHILDAVDGSLKRLKTDYLDVLLLHRPDALSEPAEIADAFGVLHAAGKVRHFGVSNQNPGQIRLLQKYCPHPLVANQLQLSITNAAMITAGLHVNMADDAAVDRDGGVLDFCRLNDITVQAWSPLQYGFFEGVFLGSDKYPELNAVIDAVAAAHKVTPIAVAIAWILRHPAKIQAIVGTMNADRLTDIVAAADVTLTREEWYKIYLAAGNILP